MKNFNRKIYSINQNILNATKSTVLGGIPIEYYKKDPKKV